MNIFTTMWKLIHPANFLIILMIIFCSHSYAQNSVELNTNNALTVIKEFMQEDDLFSQLQIKDGRLGFSINNQKARWYVEHEQNSDVVFVVYRMSSLPKKEGFRSFVRSFSPPNKSHIYFGNYVPSMNEYLAVQQQVKLKGSNYQDIRNSAIDAYNDLSDFMDAYRKSGL